MSEPSPASVCPKCAKERVLGPECPHCGVLYEKAEARGRKEREREWDETFEEEQEPLREEGAAHSPDTRHHLPAVEDARLELILRAAAIPVVLLFAYLLMHSSTLRLLGTLFMGMWVHELGHTWMAWLCGHFAIPAPWITLGWESRNPLVIVGLAVGLVYLGLYGLKNEQRVLLVAAAALLLLQVICTGLISRDTARMLITFFGDGGALVIGTALMLTVYSPRGSRIHQGWLRWGFLVIGAVAFADVLHTWIPARTDFGAIPFGMQARAGLSDASRLVEHHGWDERALVLRHLRLAWACGLVMAAAYVRGLLSARAELKEAASAAR